MTRLKRSENRFEVENLTEEVFITPQSQHSLSVWDCHFDTMVLNPDVKSLEIHNTQVRKIIFNENLKHLEIHNIVPTELETFPTSLKSLKICMRSRFTLPAEYLHFPKKLKKLFLENVKMLRLELPSKLKVFSLCNSEIKELTCNEKLRKLDISLCDDLQYLSLNNGLKKLSLYFDENKSYQLNGQRPILLPDGLLELSLDNCTWPTIELPSDLQYLSLNNCDIQSLQCNQSLKRVYLYNCEKLKSWQLNDQLDTCWATDTPALKGVLKLPPKATFFILANCGFSTIVLNANATILYVSNASVIPHIDNTIQNNQCKVDVVME